MRVAIYCRVSTKDKGQDNANQLRQLKAFAAQQNWTVVHVYEEQASGRKGESGREALREVFKDAAKRRWDLLLFWSLDRLSREGAFQTMKYLNRLSEWNIGYRSYTEEYINTTGIFGDVLIALLSTLGKQEAIRVSERTKAGLERARAQGRVGGRPRASITAEQVLRLHKTGISLTAIGKELGAGKSTVHRLLHGMNQETSKKG
jgi:DNA invertase Pin-like site-specific DNA recombinase